MKKKVKINSDPDKGLCALIGKKIQKIRKHREQSARWVAEQIGVSRAAISQIETGRNHVNAVMLLKLAKVLKCGVQDFFPNIINTDSLTNTDVEVVARENQKAAEFFGRAFKVKKS